MSGHEIDAAARLLIERVNACRSPARFKREHGQVRKAPNGGRRGIWPGLRATVIHKLLQLRGGNFRIEMRTNGAPRNGADRRKVLTWV